ncbi:hypothetical protein SAMN04487967_3433 [Natronorubrum sediminis]|uniref:Uncharacterized protein n=2 Tax=Natronorubrum TaxID=134813 RepID=A0A1N7FLP1_9EURY|nr:hypothetical protein SAMN04487967_3433 [Natronorubrum sediminis]SIS01156.1 hypothetical protein SAMN05421809_3340 [Natronorubrum daqingense]
MSQSNYSSMRIGCPECEASVSASVPPGPGIHQEQSSNRLQGTETVCRNCGHELELYYY